MSNFEVLREAFPKLAERSVDSLAAKLREHFEKLANVMQQLDRLGVPDGFGLMALVASAFNGMRHLHEVGGEWSREFLEHRHE